MSESYQNALVISCLCLEKLKLLNNNNRDNSEYEELIKRKLSSSLSCK